MCGIRGDPPKARHAACNPKQTVKMTADYADKHRASILRNLHTRRSHRCLITVTAIRTTFSPPPVTQQSQSAPALLGLDNGPQEERRFVAATAALLPQPYLLYCSPVQLSPALSGCSPIPFISALSAQSAVQSHCDRMENNRPVLVTARNWC